MPTPANGQVNHQIEVINCPGEIVELSMLTLDPMNARLHPNKNLQTIQDSLLRFGQMSPLVVRQQNRVVAKGNGTLEVMRSLGWTKAAASVVPLTDAQFYEYALVDNRASELGQWDTEQVANVDALIRELGSPGLIGYTSDELEVLRAANFEWTPPIVKEESHADLRLKIELSGESASLILRVVDRFRREVGDAKAAEADCVFRICKLWLGLIESQDQLDPLGGLI